MSEALSPNPEGKPEEVAPIVMLPLDQLRVPAWNPRKVMNEAALQRLMAFIQSGGKVPPIWAWIGSGVPPFDIISGQRRHEAYRRLAKTHIPTQILDIPLSEAIRLALAANEDDKPHWLGQFEVVEVYMKLDPSLNQADVHRLTGWTKKRVSHAVALTTILTPATRQLITQTNRESVTNGNKPVRSVTISNTFQDEEADTDEAWSLNEFIASKLAPLAANPDREVAQAQANQAVQLIIDRQLNGAQAGKLAAHLLSGQDLAQFQPATKARVGKPPRPKPLPTELADKVVELDTDKVRSAKLDSSSPQTTPGISSPSPDRDRSPSQELKPTTPNSPLQTSNSKAEHATPKAEGEKPTSEGNSGADLFMWQWLAGISFISQIKSKLKKKEKLSVGEKLLVLGWRMGEVLAFFTKPLLKLLKGAVKGLWHALKKSFGKGFSKVMEYALPILIICALIYGAGKVFQFVVVNPLHWVESKVVSVLHGGFGGTSPNGDRSPIQQSAPVVNTQKTAPVVTAPAASEPIEKKAASTEHKTKHPTQSPAGISSPSVIAFVEGSETQENINAEVAAIHDNSYIKPFAYRAGAMNFDMSNRRMEDVQDPQKYTVRFGKDQQKVLSFDTTASNCVMKVQSGLGGLLGDTSKVEFYWEDVTGFHLSEIITTRVEGGKETIQHTYQLTLLAKGLKTPITVQCANPENLERLATALEFKLQTARGTAAPITAMPYLYQGLRLNHDGQVITLWADSPMDKAGMKVGEYLWSLQTNTPTQQRKEDLEAQLQFLSTGEYPFYMVTQSRWNKGLADMKTYGLESFSPLRHKAQLIIP